MKITIEIRKTFQEFTNNPSKESFEVFRDTFIEENSMQTWNNCVDFWLEFSNADLLDYIC